MKGEPKIPQSAAEPDFRDQGVIFCILENGTDDEMESLRRHLEKKEKKPIPMKLLEMFRRFARLRRSAINAADADTAQRERENPRATAEELSLGAYVERLEPQVREAVLTLRRKGIRLTNPVFLHWMSRTSGLNKLCRNCRIIQCLRI